MFDAEYAVIPKRSDFVAGEAFADDIDHPDQTPGAIIASAMGMTIF